MKKNIKRVIVLFIGLFCLLLCVLLINNNSDLRSIKNEQQLKQIYDNRSRSTDDSFIKKVLTLPFSVLFLKHYGYYADSQWDDVRDYDITFNAEGDSVKSATSNDSDYSKTNIQVEGVDEADIIKTDGKYIYSISSEKVIITDASNPSDIKIVSTIGGDSSHIPSDLVLFNNYLVVISADNTTNNLNTVVDIYDLTNIKQPNKVKNFELYEPYYTTRCIDGKLYVISNGYLREENDHIIRDYMEDNQKYEIPYKDIKYLKDVNSKKQTLIAEVNLNDLSNNKINLSSYLIDISDSYVSLNNIYLLNTNYGYNQDELSISKLFGLKGIFGLFDDYDDSYDRRTEIYKLSINDNGITYKTKAKVEGRIVNQYSLDEKNNHLRIALQSNEGTSIKVLDENLHKIGETSKVAKGETMYSTRFMNNKAYLVTYKNTDPLFVIDLENEKNPKVLGELHIPGYSTYLHPYDDTHIIGIGMDTTENVYRDDFGKVISSSTVVTGMKMSLFDVSDVNNPRQISTVKIGDRRCVSSVLANPKALLFSKEKNLLAIPVNNYDKDFEAKESDDYSSQIDYYNEMNKSYISEGYLVYNINLSDGIKLKGLISHDKENKNTSRYYYYYYGSKMLRGLYINNNLFTVSEGTIKVNSLDTLEQISELKINEKGVNNYVY